MNLATAAVGGHDSQRPGNNFNLLRLVFASLVLVSHSYEIVDGNRSREPLTRLFHTVTLGELSVDAFFLLSGFLIVQSWCARPVLKDFLVARVLRIYPGFIVASLLCALVVGPVAAASADYFARMDGWQYAASVLTLRGPAIPPVFEGSHYPYINNSLWTIKFEMACYLVVATAGVFGLARRRSFWTVSAAACCSALVLMSVLPGTPYWPAQVGTSGPLADGVRLFSFFAVGACYQVWLGRIAYTRISVLGAGVLLLALLSSRDWAEPALALLGSHLLFGLAFARSPWLEWLRPRTDISYGIYLYAWPIQKLLVMLQPQMPVGAVVLLTWVASAVMGWLSWQLVEAPAMRLKQRLLKRHKEG